MIAPIFTITGSKRTQKSLRQLSARASGRVSISVGYATNYATIVHETHRTKKKFLETPFRTLREELVRVIHEVAKRAGNLKSGIVAAAWRLKRESQLLVPVDTGNLKNSAFVRDDVTRSKMELVTVRSRDALGRFMTVK